MECNIAKAKEKLEHYKDKPIYEKSPSNRAVIDKALGLMDAAIAARSAVDTSNKVTSGIAGALGSVDDANSLRSKLITLAEEHKKATSKAKREAKEKDYSKLVAPEFAKLPKADGKKRFIYAGIGSTKTPVEERELMTDVAKELSKKGYKLLSGGAPGADMAFEGYATPDAKDYESTIKMLKTAANKRDIGKYIKDAHPKNTKLISVMRGDGIYGNPFDQYTVNTSDTDVMSAMFHDWLVHNKIPSTYKQNKVVDLKELSDRRKNILNNLYILKNKDIFYKGTAAGKDLSHAAVLAMLANSEKFKATSYLDTPVSFKPVARNPIKNKNIFYSWDINGNNPNKLASTAINVAKEIHPKENLGSGSNDGLALHARNTFQVFGKNLDTPVDFVLFYAEETDGIRPKGGTGQAVVMARLKGIPTINIGKSDWKDQLEKVQNGEWVEPEEYRKVREAFEKANKGQTANKPEPAIMTTKELAAKANDIVDKIKQC